MLRLIGTIALNLLIILLLGIFIYFGYKLYAVYQKDNTALTQFIDPRFVISLITQKNEAPWKTYESVTFTFEHPSDWEPRRTDLFSNGTETIDLKIPVFYLLSEFGGNTIIGYSKESVEQIRQSLKNIEFEEPIVIANRRGSKWIYKVDKKYHYVYAVSLQSYNYTSKLVQTFTLHVETGKKDKNLEEKLDRVSQSVKFKFEEQQGG